jgi:hypothetical protein
VSREEVLLVFCAWLLNPVKVIVASINIVRAFMDKLSFESVVLMALLASIFYLNNTWAKL